MYKNRVLSVRKFTCIVDDMGQFLRCMSPSIWLTWYLGIRYLVVSTYTFWRFLLEIPLADSEMKVRYSINGGPEMDFFVPGRHQTMRLAAHSVKVRNCHRALAILTKSNHAVQRIQRQCELG
jgi:hypothetical protein